MAVLAHLGFRLNFLDDTLCSALFPSVYLSIDLPESISSSLLRSFCWDQFSYFWFILLGGGGAEGTSTTEWEPRPPNACVARAVFTAVGVTGCMPDSSPNSSEQKNRVAQEPNRNRKPEPSEPFSQEPNSQPEPPEPFSRNRNRNRNRPLCEIVLKHRRTPSLEEQGNRKPELLEPFHPQTVTEPNRTGATLKKAHKLFAHQLFLPPFYPGLSLAVDQTGTFVQGTNWVCPRDKPGVVPRATGPKTLCLCASSCLNPERRLPSWPKLLQNNSLELLFCNNLYYKCANRALVIVL